MKSISLIFLLVTIFLTGYGQKKPWEDAPKSVEATGMFFYADGREAFPPKAHLVLDTLKRFNDTILFSTFPDTVTVWKEDSSPIIGYGYIDTAGIPHGIWKYYKLARNGYQLYCEGYYLKPSTSNFVLGRDKELKAQEFQILVKSLVESQETKLMLTGEWRFYENGFIKKRLFFAKESTMLVSSIFSFDANGNVLPEEKSFLLTPWRIFGDITGYEIYNFDGSIKASVHRHGLSTDFKEGGKPVLEPLAKGYHD